MRAKEHVIPAHIQRRYALAKERLLNSHSRIVRNDFAGGHITVLPVQRELTFSGFLAGEICFRCNNGWMSNLENAVAPFLYDLIDANVSITNTEHQERALLACWSFKTAAALSSISTLSENIIPRSHARGFYRSEAMTLPVNVGVFATTASSRDFLWSFSPTWSVSGVRGEPLELLQLMQEKSYKVFLQLGHLMIAVCWWPYNAVTYTLEPWVGAELSGLQNVHYVKFEPRELPGAEAETFLLAIGARLMQETRDSHVSL